MRGGAAAVTFPGTFIALVYSQIELLQIKLKKVNYIFFVIFGRL
jgi:hypothetical protein